MLNSFIVYKTVIILYHVDRMQERGNFENGDIPPTCLKYPLFCELYKINP